MKRIDLKVVSIVVFVVGMILLLILNAPISEKKAVALAQQYQEQGMYCSGFHYEKGDNTCEVIFKDSQTGREKKSIITSYATAEKIYDEYGA